MKKHTLVFALVSIFVVVPVFGNDDAADAKGMGWCRLDGSWFLSSAGGGGPYTINAAMTSPHKGVATVVWSGVDPTFFGFCPNSVELSIAQGAITRTGRRSFELTVITFTQEASGQVECIGKSNMWVELDPGCDSGRMNGQIEFYHGDENPFGDVTPWICFPPTAEDYPMVKMTVDQPDPTCP